MQYTIDRSKEIEKVFEKMFTKYFPQLKILNFLYTWRSKEKFIDGQIILAEVFKMSPRDRDLWGFDVRVEIFEDTWMTSNHKTRCKLAYHELCHIELSFKKGIEKKKKKNVKVDKEGRICFKIRSHDVALKRFISELKVFGLDEGEDRIRRFLNKVHKRVK